MVRTSTGPFERALDIGVGEIAGSNKARRFGPPRAGWRGGFRR